MAAHPIDASCGDSLQSDEIVSPDAVRAHRVPPGQTLTAIDRATGTAKWPVLDAAGPPAIDLSSWTLRLFGSVASETSFTWEEFNRLPRSRVRCDIHCVTGRSRLDNLFEGPTVRTVMQHVRVQPEARFVLVHAHDKVGADWSTNLPLDLFLAHDCLFATHHDGEPLSVEHGGPCRLVVPRLYFWKSAKWVKAVEFRTEDFAGFWEQNGYHMRGDPWEQERFR
jgi:DMSO/TMAO reductase YedYZ molybdopterin-dependent catalytic subunit